MVFIGQQKFPNLMRKPGEEQVASSYYITICECDDLESEIELVKTHGLLKMGATLQLMI